MPVMEARAATPDVAARKITIVKDTAIGLAARMGGPLSAGAIEQGPDGPAFAHTRFIDRRRGVSYSSNGLRSVGEDGEHGQGLLVAQAEPMSPMRPDSTEKRISNRFPLNLAPFTLRNPTTPVGLAVAELDRNTTVRHENYIARPRLLDRGTILVATAVPDAEVRQHDSMAFPINSRKNKEWQRKEIQERRYPLTTLDALINNATAYMDAMNAIREPGNQETTVSQRQAINHVLRSLTLPEPVNKAVADNRSNAGVPTNVDAKHLYRQLLTQHATPVHSEITDVTYTQPTTLRWIQRWVKNQLNKGSNELSTYFEASQRIIQARMQAKGELQQGERVAIEEMIEATQRASQPPAELIFPPLPDASFFRLSPPEQIEENLAHYREERAMEIEVFRRRHGAPQPAKR